MGVEYSVACSNLHIAESGFIPQTVQVLKQLSRVFTADKVSSVGGGLEYVRSMNDRGLIDFLPGIIAICMGCSWSP